MTDKQWRKLFEKITKQFRKVRKLMEKCEEECKKPIEDALETLGLKKCEDCGEWVTFLKTTIWKVRNLEIKRDLCEKCRDERLAYWGAK